MVPMFSSSCSWQFIGSVGFLLGVLFMLLIQPHSLYQLCKWLHFPYQRLPNRLIFIRHGESQGNINHHLYETVPDSSMHLTPLGAQQAQLAGQQIKQLIGEESVRFIVSPYVRTIETFERVVEAFANKQALAVTEEPRIREQDFGNFQDPVEIASCKSERRKFGSFFYRFPSGESPADVYDRISSFFDSLYRLFERKREKNYILVSHGITSRVMLMRYFRLSIQDFEELENFQNGQFVVLENDGYDAFRLERVVYPQLQKDNGQLHICQEKQLRLICKGNKVEYNTTIPLVHSTK